MPTEKRRTSGRWIPDGWIPDGQARPRRTVAMGYALVITSVALTTLMRLSLNPLLGRKAALIMYFPALVLSAWVGGWAGGLLALALSALTATYLFISPNHSFFVINRTDQLTLLIFGIVGLSVSALSASQRRARQQAEDSATALRDSEAFLRNSEARKSAVLEAALDCIITADAQGRILEFNPAAERTFGYTRAEVLGMPIADAIVPPSLREAHLRGLTHYLATGVGPLLRQRIEVVGMRKGGDEFPVEIAIVPTTEGNGNTGNGNTGNGNTGRSGVEFTAYLRDISESRNAAARQRKFLRDVLASVTEGHLILCDTDGDLPAPLASVGEPIALSRESGLRELRQMALGAAEGLTQERRHDLLTAVGEASMNSVVHGGGGMGWVSIGADGTVQVRVEDQGTGISMENLPKATLARGFSTKATLGHGIKMMLETTDRLYLLTGPKGTTVVLEQGQNRPIHPNWL